MLRALGSAWYDLRGLSPQFLETAIVDEARVKLKDAIQSHYGDTPLLVLKDPRFCRSFPVIRSVIDDDTASLRIIFCFRNPLDVARSLNTRDGIALQHGLGLWLRYMLDGEFHSRGLQRVFVDFADFLQDWRTIISRIEQGLGIHFSRKEACTSEVDEFIDAGLRHHSASIEELEARLGNRGSVQSCYEAFSALVREPSSIEAMGQLDLIRDQFESNVVFGEAIQEYYAQILAARSAEETFNKQLSEFKAQLAESTARLAESKSRLVESKARLAESKARLAESKAQYKAINAQLVNTEQRLRAIKHSWSWRLTKPLRTFAAFMRKIRKRF